MKRERKQVVIKQENKGHNKPELAKCSHHGIFMRHMHGALTHSLYLSLSHQVQHEACHHDPRAPFPSLAVDHHNIAGCDAFPHGSLLMLPFIHVVLIGHHQPGCSIATHFFHNMKGCRLQEW